MDEYALMLTRRQLEHLRDLMSVRLPPDYSSRISTELAGLEKRQDEETNLWKKVFALCHSVGIDVGESAPDFTLDATSTPKLEVVPLDPDEIE